MKLLSKKASKPAIIVVSIIIPLIVALLLSVRLPKELLPFNAMILPPLIALVNSITALCLIFALFFIKNKNVPKHRLSINIAVILSIVFLILYVIYHAFTDPTKYGGTGILRGLYYFLLLTHIVLSTVVIPFVLFTYLRGYNMEFELHRKLAKITYPLWLYVAISGVLCYIMLAPYYPAY